MDDVMPGRDGPENLRILKKSQLRRQRVGSSAIEACGQVLQIYTDRDLKHPKMRRVLGGVCIVRIMSLSSCHHELQSRN